MQHSQRFIHRFWCDDLKEVTEVFTMLDGVLFDYTIEAKPSSGMNKPYRRAKEYQSDCEHLLILTLDSEVEEAKLRLKLNKDIVKP
jgi:hypothetical protein